MAEGKPEREINWSFVEEEYRAGLRSLRDIASEAGITEGAIRRKAKVEDWTRDLSAKIHRKAGELVRKEGVRKDLRDVRKDGSCVQPTEKQVVEANAQAIAFVDLSNRKDVQAAINVSRAQLEELAVLGDPQFAETLALIGEVCREEGRTDKVNDTYHYIIGLAGRVKMAKDIAASVGTYIPMQRKILKLDVETDKNLSGFDALLAKVNAQNSE